MAITGYPDSYKAPFHAVEIEFAQGATNAPEGERAAIYVGPKLSTGSATNGTVYEIGSEADAITYFGAGSALHRQLRMHLKANPNGRLYALSHAETSSGSPAQSDMTITVSFGSGSNPAATGRWEADVCGELCTGSFTTSDTATTIGDAIEAAINAKTWLPLTASNSSGTVTLTAKHNGAFTGDGTTGVYRVRSRVFGDSNTVLTDEAAALGLGTGTDGADGTTTNAANFNGALANIASSLYYYIACPFWDSTSLGHLKTHISTKSDPNPGLRSRGFWAFTGTLAAGQTLATGLNYERMQALWQKNSEHDPSELAAQYCAITQKREQVDPAYNFDQYNEPDWHILPAYSNADWPDGDDLDDAVTDGLTPVQSTQTGSYLVMAVTNRSKDSAGSLDDFRVLEPHRVSVLDKFATEVRNNFVLTYGGSKLKDDVRLPDGTVDPNQRFPSPIGGQGVITPSLVRPWFANWIDVYTNDLGLFQGQSTWTESLEVKVNPNNSSRLSVRMGGRTIDLLHQSEITISETSPG